MVDGCGGGHWQWSERMSNEGLTYDSFKFILVITCEQGDFRYGAVMEVYGLVRKGVVHILIRKFNIMTR